MIDFIEENLAEIRSLCQRYDVARLEICGSAVEGKFDPQNSDIDSLVEYIPGHSLGPWMCQYFNFKEDLQELLGRKVALIMASALRNPWFIREVNKTRRPLYAA